MNQFDFSTSEDIMSYYYNVNTDTFHSKIEWLDQNALIDRIIVDKSATAQQVDKFFEIVYTRHIFILLVLQQVVVVETAVLQQVETLQVL